MAPNVAGNADLAELRVTNGGTLAGIQLVENPAGLTPATLATLPAVTVSSGDIVVIHLNAPAGVTGETSSKTQCVDSACYSGAWDVVGGSAGVDFGNTVLVARGASGRIQDGIPFTDGSAAPLSFLSELLALQNAGLWLPATCGGSACTYATSPTAQGVSVDWSSVGTTPSGASVSRTANADTNAKADWAVGAGQSLGAANP